MEPNHITNSVERLQMWMHENPLAAAIIVVAGILVLLIPGGILLSTVLERRREYQKAQAVRRLQAHVQRTQGRAPDAGN